MSQSKAHHVSTDMTEGALLPKILRFCLPLIAANLLQVAFNMADTVVVGLSAEPDAVGAVGTTTSFINLIVNTFIGCSVGTKVVMARSLGSGNRKTVEEVLHTSIVLSVVAGLFCAVLGLAVSAPVLTFMGNEGRLYELALLYTRIYFIGVPFVSVVNFTSAILNAAGNTKAPMFILSSGGVLNILLNLFFVLVCGMSVDGVALATVLSNAFCALMLIVCLMRDEGFRLRFKGMSVSRTQLGKILHVGLPAGLQSMLFSLSHMLIQSSVLTVNELLSPPDSAYAPVVKGVSVCTSIEGFASITVSSVGQAAVCFVGQNAGAHKFDRVKKVQRLCYAVGAVAAVVVAGLLMLLHDPLFALYGVHRAEAGSLEQIAYDTAWTRMLYMFVPYFLLAFMEVGSGVLQGLGRAVTAAGISLTGSCVFRVVWLLTVFPMHPTLGCIFVSFPISWFVTALAHFVFSGLALRKEEAQVR